MKIALQAVTKSYRDTSGRLTAALTGCDLAVQAGEFVAVLGPTGCGKSTLLHLVAGLEQPGGGRVLVDGDPVRGPGPDRVVLFQEPLLFPWLTLRQNVLFGPQVRRDPDPALPERVEGLLVKLMLDGFADHYPHQLSGGMKQRGALARAMIGAPAVLLMDEPFAALDAWTRREMWQLLLQVWEANRQTVVFVTHDMDEALLLADRVVVMSGRPGRVREEFPVPLPRPRDGAGLTEAPRELKERILAAIRQDQAASDPESKPNATEE